MRGTSSFASGRKLRRGPCGVQRLAPVVLLLLFVAYGAWFLAMLSSQGEENVDSSEEPRTAVAAARVAPATAAARVAPATAAPVIVATTPGSAAGASHPAGNAGNAGLPERRKPSSSAGAHCNYTAGPATSGLAAHLISKADAIPLSGRLLAGAGEPLDHSSLTLGAWVYTDATAYSIQTVLATKAAGCTASAAHDGFSLFVNEWESSSQQAWLSWGSATSGCEELGSRHGAVAMSTWTHLAASFSPADDSSQMVVARLFVNGRLVASSENKAVGMHKYSQPAGLKRRLQMDPRAGFIGLHADETHAFHGAIDEVTAWHGSLGALQIEALASACELPAVAGARLVLWQSFDEPEAAGSATTPRTKAASSFPNVLVLPTQRAQPVPLAVPSSMAPTGVQLERDTAPLPTAEERRLSDELALSRREAVRAGFKHAWDGYRKFAWGHDELKPRSNGSKDWLHQAATMVDSLDCLWIMGFKEEFNEARDWIAANLHFTFPAPVSVFETIIRSLGGLLSAYELSSEPVFLAKAVELADSLLRAFNSPTGLPCTTLNMASGVCTFPSWTGQSAILSEFGTVQLEFKALTQHTGDAKYATAALRIMKLVHSLPMVHGMAPTYMSARTGRFTNGMVTFGALGDSYYEYLLKQWVQTGKREPWLRQMYDAAMDGMATHLVFRSKPSGLVYIADHTGKAYNHKMDHLACFVGAMLALGAQDGRPNDQRDLAIAEGLAETCYQMYARQPTGLSPEYASFAPGSHDFAVPNNAKFNILRPEAIETLFYLHYYTHRPKYREQGWAMWQAFEKWCRTDSGYSSIPNVLDTTHKQEDKMESFFLAETIKYFYLLFDPTNPIPLDKYVFNTEAHPLRILDQPREELLGSFHGIQAT